MLVENLSFKEHSRTESIPVCQGTCYEIINVLCDHDSTVSSDDCSVCRHYGKIGIKSLFLSLSLEKRREKEKIKEKDRQMQREVLRAQNRECLKFPEVPQEPVRCLPLHAKCILCYLYCYFVNTNGNTFVE